MTIAIICFTAGVLLLGGWLLLHYCQGSRQFLRRLLINCYCGIGALTVMNALAGITQLSLPVNALSLGTGVILGAPGVMGLYAMLLFM